jgi:N-acetylglucosamine malate deacetylase 1
MGQRQDTTPFPSVSPVDALAIGAHPDDIEVGIGGLVAKMARTGRRVALLDLTRGEMGTRGTVEERSEEAVAAADILGAAARENAGLPDGALADTDAQRLALIPWIRAFRPKVLLVPETNDRHPDHHAAAALARSANYFAGLTRIETGQEPWRAPAVYGYRVYVDPDPPAAVVDISGDFMTKIEALRAHRSQFHNPDYEGPDTFVASEAFWESIEARARYWGGRVGTTYGEPLWIDRPLALHLPPELEETS